MTDAKLKAKMKPVLERVLNGETVEIGIFQVWEDFLYTRKKNWDGSPQFKRVICLVYFDEEEDASPSTEDFDGTLDSFLDCIEAHSGFEMDQDQEDDSQESEATS